MSVENFYQGEEVSARKLNNLVCAINGLCSTMQALQRDQTIAGLGQNDRPRMLGRTRDCGYEGGEGKKGKHYSMCFLHVTQKVYMPPWGVIGTRRREWDSSTCTYVLKTRYYVESGVWKEGQARPAGVWCSIEKQGSDSTDGLAGQWNGPEWTGGWIEEPESGNYLFATNEGKLIVKNSLNYDWRYERLIADLSAWETPNGWDNPYIARNGCTEMIFFPKQYWTGDICQPKARWEQGGMFSVRLDPRKKNVIICGGMALVEGPLAVGGNKYFEQGTGVTYEVPTLLVGTGGYYTVPGFCSPIPAVESGSRQYLYLGYDEASTSCTNFWWFWLTDTVSYAREQIPIFVWNISTTSEVGFCNTYVVCTTWESKQCNYTQWKMAMPMGVAYKGDCGYVCVAVAQHVPQFRARPIVNLQGAGLICSTGNDWDSDCNKKPHGCATQWVTGENDVCSTLEEDDSGIYLDVLASACVVWTKDCAECLCEGI